MLTHLMVKDSFLHHHICSTYVSLQREGISVWIQSEAYAGLHSPHMCTIPPAPGGLRRCLSVRVPLCGVGSSGTIASLCCCPFGRLHAAFQRGAPPAARCSACWSLTRCAHSAAARQASEGRLSHSNWRWGSGWSKVFRWLSGPGKFPFSDVLQCLVIWLPPFLSAQTLSLAKKGKALTSAGFIKHASLMRHDRTGLSSLCPFIKKIFFLIRLSSWVTLKNSFLKNQ